MREFEFFPQSSPQMTEPYARKYIAGSRSEGLSDKREKRLDALSHPAAFAISVKPGENELNRFPRAVAECNRSFVKRSQNSGRSCPDSCRRG
jgi:hypothetical protein